MVAAFLSFLHQQQLLTSKGCPTLLAVSGGVDSVVLCHLFKQGGLPFAIAHCNFTLRGQESEEEAQFVHHLATFYQVAHYVERFDTKRVAAEHKVSIQMAARDLRYDFFDRLLHQYRWDRVATAHHQDDSMETMLLNFTKGSTIKGLWGIQPIHGKVIRPLLFAHKKEIIAYAVAEKLTWKEDSSNQNIDYQRNFIRHKVLPLLHTINPNLAVTAQNRAIQLQEMALWFQHELQQIAPTLCTTQDGMYHIAIDQIVHLPWATILAFELVAPYGFTFQQIQKLIAKPMASGKVIYATHYVLFIDRKSWVIRKRQQVSLKQAMVYNHTAFLDYGKHIFYFKRYPYQTYPKTPLIAVCDYHKLRFPLTIRPWQAGDLFYPLAMQGCKKVSDLLVDLKVARAIKDQVMVVTSQEKIVWVVGYRLDERFKVDEHTTQIFEINRRTQPK